MEVNVGAHDVYVGTMVAAAEMIESGVTSFADHYFFMDEAARAVDESGMRANLGSAFFSSQGDDGLASSVDFAERWHGRAGGRITTSIAPHAPYTCDDDDLRVRPTQPAGSACVFTPTPPRTCTRRNSASTVAASRRSRCSPTPACSTPE